MQRIVTLSIAGISLGLACLHPALAADMALMPLKAPVPIAPPFSWTGFYLGGNVGAGFGTTETSVNVGPALTAVTGTPVAATAPLVSETFNSLRKNLGIGALAVFLPRVLGRSGCCEQTLT
jgi:hypothetical protein